MAMCLSVVLGRGGGTNNNLIHDSLFVVDVKTDQHRIFPPSNKPQKCFIPKVMRFVAVLEYTELFFFGVSTLHTRLDQKYNIYFEEKICLFITESSIDSSNGFD